MKTFFFLFSEKIPLERFEWIINLLKNKEINVLRYLFYISGDALYSLQDRRYYRLWDDILKLNHIKIILDGWDLKLLGISIPNEIKKHESKLEISVISNALVYWNKLIEDIEANKFGEIFGFLEMRGPYISRTSVHSLRSLRAAINHDMAPELYSYLDGVHLGHDCQKPSEFENIGEGLVEIQDLAKTRGLDSLMLACSRCGTARGYLRGEEIEAFHQSEDSIPSFLFCNLNRIVDRFESHHVILSPTSGMTYGDGIEEENKSKSPFKPPITIFITHSPYGSEWTFGGISFAMACANHDILTNVVFIEDGVLILTGEHNVKEQEGIFNLQEIIEATHDIENLNFFAHEPSLETRGITDQLKLEGLKIIDTSFLNRLLLDEGEKTTQNLKRIIFF